MKLVICIFLIFPSLIFAKKNLSAHVHGAVSLDMAIDKNQLLLMIKSPAESFVGFEYKAKSKKEKDLVKQIEKDWKESALKFIGPDSFRDCKLTSTSWKQTFEGKSHSTIEAEAYIDCENAISGREIKTTFFKVYKNFKKINFQLIKEDGNVVVKKHTKDFSVKL